MGVTEIIEAAESVEEYDQARQEAFRREFSSYEAGGATGFEATREAIADEREAIGTLADGLEREASNIEELVDRASFLTVDQAVRHREATVEKLRAHNDHLWAFHDAMAAALDAIEANLDALAVVGPEAVDADPEPHFERAHGALEAHNDVVEGVDRNMMILNAYLVTLLYSLFASYVGLFS